MNKQLWILLSGRILTNIADSMYMIAAVWFVKTAADSAFLVGLTSAVAMLPVTLQFLYGPLIDRFSKRKILYIAQVGQGILVGVIGILYLSSALWLPVLLLLMFLALSLSEITYPTESALIKQLAADEKLTKVNSVFAFSYQTLDLVADAVSGILIAFIGLGYIFVSNSLLLIATGLLFFFYLSIPKTEKEKQPSALSFFQQYREDFIEGYNAVKNQRTLLAILAGIIAINVLATMGLAMLPVISKSPAEYGFWLAAMSGGTLTGTLLASRLEHLPLNRIMPAVSFIAGISWLLAFVTSGLFIIPYVFFFSSWIGIGILSIYIQTLIQVNLPEDYIGIGFAFLSSLLGSLSPIGYVLGGLLGEFSSGMLTLHIAGSGYFVFALYFFLHPSLRRLDLPLSVKLD
ncbi:MFS transporter [Bacillus marinisedimentorum]|uniref:MFS transporter n=1 Tax=Bacillus marinisedimentorum TaxID=1821260 RepID=UPI0007E06339|nr:MFS transporter [Bacillus marinisedimentorum]